MREQSEHRSTVISASTAIATVATWGRGRCYNDDD